MTKRSCGAHSLHLDYSKMQKGYANARRNMEAYSAIQERISVRGVLTVPVVFHIVYHDEQLNLSDAVILDQLNILNENFRAQNADVSNVPEAFRGLIADVEIEFVLAKRDPLGRPTNGITRTKTTVKVFPNGTPPPNEGRSFQIAQELMSDKTGKEGWPRDHYMNVWVCDMSMDPLGFATYPGAAEWDDCIVVDVRAFGRHPNVEPWCGLGRTLVHETGHWFNLVHLWGDENAGCNSTDNVNDTPVQYTFNEKEPTYPSISCNNGPHGDLFMNFLDIVDDHVMVMFTQGQKSRMRVALNGPRRSLLQGWALEEPIQAVSNQRFANVMSDSDAKTLTELLKVKGMPDSPEIFDGVSWVQAVK